jgi:peptidoglycan/xylan/chitin deacetylase (PgdA/CDA1 family)
MAYLTFDDQPNGNTPYVLSILNAHGNIKATFFILGQNLDLFGAYLPNIVGRGHAIGLHSMNHEYPWYTDTAYASPSEQMEQLIAKVSAYGVQSNLWRAPGGVWEPVLPEPYNKIFYRYQWDINPEDLVGRTSDDIYSSYVAAMNAKADDSIIILLHGWTPSVLPPIIDDLVRRGYQFGTLPRPSDSIGPIITD